MNITVCNTKPCRKAACFNMGLVYKISRRRFCENFSMCVCAARFLFQLFHRIIIIKKNVLIYITSLIVTNALDMKSQVS